MKYTEETIEMMEEASRLLGVEPGRIEITNPAPINDWDMHITYVWTMDECERPIGDRTIVFDRDHAPLALVQSFVETLSRSLRDSREYEYIAKHVYFHTPVPMDNEEDVWRIGGRARHSPKTLLNDLLLMRAEMVMHACHFFDQPVPTPAQALVEALRSIHISELLEDLKEYQKTLGGAE